MTINKRIATSLLTIGAAGALLVGATFAFFSDSGTSNGNIFSTGTLDLKLLNGVATESSTFSDNVTATFGMSNMAPGTCTADATLTLKNAGTINAGSVTVAGSNTDDALASKLKLQTITFGGSGVAVADANSNGLTDLHDLAAGATLPSGLLASQSKVLVANVCLDNSADNSLQNHSDTLSLTFTLNQ